MNHTHYEILALLADAVEDAGGVENFQALHDVWNVNAILKGRRKPNDGVLHAIGYRQVLQYEPLKK